MIFISLKFYDKKIEPRKKKIQNTENFGFFVHFQGFQQKSKKRKKYSTKFKFVVLRIFLTTVLKRYLHWKSFCAKIHAAAAVLAQGNHCSEFHKRFTHVTYSPSKLSYAEHVCSHASFSECTNLFCYDCNLRA
jgi:hypothetical protein